MNQPLALPAEERSPPGEAGSREDFRHVHLSSHLLRKFWTSEKKAILLFHRRLENELQREVSLEETLACWEHEAGIRWRRAKMRIDGQRQLEEIERHKYFVSQRLGYDVGWEFAALDWVRYHADPWRRWWEEQPAACPRMEQEVAARSL